MKFEILLWAFVLLFCHVVCSYHICFEKSNLKALKHVYIDRLEDKTEYFPQDFTSYCLLLHFSSWWPTYFLRMKTQDGLYLTRRERSKKYSSLILMERSISVPNWKQLCHWKICSRFVMIELKTSSIIRLQIEIFKGKFINNPCVQNSDIFIINTGSAHRGTHVKQIECESLTWIKLVQDSI
jgi:hypothetical protein